MAVWSTIHSSDFGFNTMLAAEQYHPEKLSILEYLRASSGKRIEQLFYEVEDIVIPGANIESARLYDLTDAIDNILRPGADISDSKFLSNRKRVRSGDIIVSRLRSYLREIALIPSLPHEALVSPEFIVLRLRPESGLTSSAWLLPFLLTEQVQTVLKWSQTGSAHPRFNSETLLSLKVPDSIITNSDLLTKEVEEAHKKHQASVDNYLEADEILVDELKLFKLSKVHSNAYTANFSEVARAERLDAEYYRPKYYELFQSLVGTGSASPLGKHLIEKVHRGVQPTYVEGGNVAVIKSQHIGQRYIELNDPDAKTTEEFVAEKNNRRAKVSFGDVLMNSTGVSTIGRCQALLSENKAIADGHIALIRPDGTLDPVYLAAFLNSAAGYLQTERYWTGSSGQIELRPESIENYLIWIAPMNFQLSIRKKIELSHELRSVARRKITSAQQVAENLI